MQYINNKEFRQHKSGLLVSENGEVFVPKSKRYPNGHFTYGSDDGKGYLVVMYKGKHHKVHRLVAECFIPNPDNLPIVNHKDENPSNNNYLNLEWCDCKYNDNYGTRNKRIGNALSKQIAQYSKDGELIKIYKSANDAGRSGFSVSAIVSCANNKYGHKSHKGYLWKYIYQN